MSNIVTNEIDQNGFPIKNLPDPVDPKDPVTLDFFEENLPASSSNLIEVVATHADISDSIDKRFIYVMADENNNDNISLYIYTGTQLKLLQTVS